MSTMHNGPQNVFAVSRAVFDHPLVGAGNAGKDPWNLMEAWLWLISAANYRTSEIEIRGEVVTLKRGQLLTTVGALAKRWNWTDKQVRTFLDKICRHNLATRETGTPKGSRPSVLTLSNYDIYQFLEGHLGQPKRQPKGSPTATQRQHPIKNNKDNTKTESGCDLIGERKNSGNDVDAFLAAYNEGARKHGWVQQLVAPPKALNWIKARLSTIGGLENGLLALSMIHNNDFLMGRKRPKAGDKPFQLTLGYLLKENGRDELAELLNAAQNRKISAASDFEDKVRQVAQSKSGRQILATHGEERGMEEVRRTVEKLAGRAAA